MKRNGVSTEPLNFAGYSDVDFAAGKADRKSITGGYIEVAGMPIVWFTRKQGGVSLSTMEAEFTAASIVVAEMIGIKEVLGEMGIHCVIPMPLKVNNQAALKQLGGKSSSKAKHIDVRIKFVGLHAKCGLLKTEYCEGAEKSHRFTSEREKPLKAEGAHDDGLNENAHDGGVLEIERS
uniref:Polyprotein putative n=1 Tax=Albugo laibachii Nc14 TaxID=890382 RepID=F0WQA4_9STRA|nr:polyprotein putative [Albugo laibachii Nc14]|eukprot:CCA23512.1 polyprotein putative [Albugo laibachii Nc14]